MDVTEDDLLADARAALSDGRPRRRVNGILTRVTALIVVVGVMAAIGFVAYQGGQAAPATPRRALPATPDAAFFEVPAASGYPVPQSAEPEETFEPAPSHPTARPSLSRRPQPVTAVRSHPSLLAATSSATSPAVKKQPAPTRPAPTTPTWQTVTIAGTQVLNRGQSWSSNRLRFALGTDGNVVLTDQGRQVWQTGTSGRGGVRVVMQGDGNLVLYDTKSNTVWSTRTDAHVGAVLVLGADGTLKINQRGTTLWQA